MKPIISEFFLGQYLTVGYSAPMRINFSKAQVARASEMSQTGKAVVARVLFGDFDRFCAVLTKTRFATPCVFIYDAEQVDEVYPSLPAIVWQGKVEDLDRGVEFVLSKYEVPTLRD